MFGHEQGETHHLLSGLKFWYLPVANGGLAALPNGAINGNLRLAKIVFHGASLGRRIPTRSATNRSPRYSTSAGAIITSFRVTWRE